MASNRRSEDINESLNTSEHKDSSENNKIQKPTQDEAFEEESKIKMEPDHNKQENESHVEDIQKLSNDLDQPLTVRYESTANKLISSADLFSKLKAEGVIMTLYEEILVQIITSCNLEILETHFYKQLMKLLENLQSYNNNV